MMKFKNALARTALSAFLVISGSAVADDNEVDSQDAKKAMKAEKAFEKVEREAEKARKRADKKAEKDARKTAERAEKEAKKVREAKGDAG